MFASDLDATTRRQLDRGSRLTELLRQPQYSPYPVEEQVVSVWAGLQGLIDEVPVDDVLRFEREMLDYLRHHSDVPGTTSGRRRSSTTTPPRRCAARSPSSRRGSRPPRGNLLVGREEHEPLDEEDVDPGADRQAEALTGCP